jgi:hypothetical protein
MRDDELTRKISGVEGGVDLTQRRRAEVESS